jgi:pimeloyl-ACP methyl ester carboxylesterase
MSMAATTRPTRRLRRSLAILAGVIVALPLLAALGQMAAAAWDRARFDPPGAMIAVGEETLHVHCRGPSAAPVVMLSNGMGVVAEAWAHVQEALVQDHRVCAYDRAGTGWSAPATGAQDAGAAADRLAGLVDALDIAGPVVVAGHSYGGLVARVFADRHPDRVAGLVLVDSSHQDMQTRLPPEGQAIIEQILSSFATLERANRFAALRLVGAPEPWMAGLPEAQQARARALYATVAHMRGAAAEAAAWQEGPTLAQARAIEGFGDLPLSVLVADAYPDHVAAAWLALQRELAALSMEGRFVVVEGADHFGLVQRPDHAARIAAEIRRVAAGVAPGS